MIIHGEILSGASLYHCACYTNYQPELAKYAKSRAKQND
jgi:hypothetical protein